MKYLKTALPWGFLALAITTLWLLMLFPAQLLYRFVPGELRESLSFSIQQLQGTLWQGRAIRPATSQVQLDQLEWNLSPSSLLVLQPAMTFSATGMGATLSGHSVFSDNSLHLSNIQGQGELSELFAVVAQGLPRNSLSAFGSQLASGVEGQLALELEELQIDEKGCELLKGKMLFNEVAVPLWPEKVDLEATLSCIGNALVIQITDTGDLSLKARLRVEPDGRYSLIGSLAPSDPEQLNLIRLTGAEERNGRFEFESRG
ncbi:MAG: type II secretion system protein N [Endozoicomonas sp.]